MAFASYYSFPPLSFQLNSLYEGDPFQLNNFEGRGFCRQPARLWFGGCGSGWGAGVREVKLGNIGIFCLCFHIKISISMSER